MENKLHNIMLAGTGSDVGKSIIATALCRILLQDGYQPAPFKAQNMALNSAATPDGFEIGRAQMVQAEACRIPATTDMNPLLLKPNSNHTSQVVLNGKPIGNQNAYDYFNRPSYKTEVCKAFDRLATQYSPIVLEGAGSVSELNLRDHDIVNLPMAQHAKAKVILVADIDRGGVFASCYGSIMLQTPEDKALIAGIIINKFRGDIRLFEEGKRILEEVCGVPVLGVIPYYKDIHIEEEDSMSLASKAHSANATSQDKVNIAVVMLRHLSNFTDFDRLEHDCRVNLFYTNNPRELEQADIIILPGTKSTLADLYEIRNNGVAEAILQAHRKGTQIVGICGGYQMLGTSVADPEHVEGNIERLPGLGLLPSSTTMHGGKVTQQVTFTFDGQQCQGYEIHQGTTTCDEQIERQPGVMGTYIHGILDNAPVIDWLLSPFAQTATPTLSYAEYKDQQYDLLAQHVRNHLDMDKFYEILTQR